MAQNDLLDTPLNNPNQEIKLAESNLKARDTSVQPATRDYFQEAMDVSSGNTSAFDNAPISKAENLLRARAQKEKNFALNNAYRDIYQGTTQSQDDFLNSQGGAAELVADKDAFIQEIDDPLKYVSNVALNVGSGITELATGWVQAPASDMIDEEADTASLAPFLLRDKELQSLLAKTTDPTEIANLSAELESVTNMLDSSYNDELVAQRDAALAALNESPDNWQAANNLKEIEWALERTPTKRQVRERAESNVDGAVATYNFLENVSEVVASKVNKAGQRKIQRQVEPYAVEASAFYENGNYAESIGVMADGIFTVALDNPGSAVEMFANSLPQMLAMVNPFTSAPTVMASYSKHADTMMEEFVKINGYRATGKDKELLNTGAGAAVFFDFFSDKIALKGVKVIPTNLINKITAKLGSGAPKGAKIFTQYATNVAARVASLAIQPVQEFVSGAGTELSEQAGVAGSLEGLDTAKIIEQGMIESIAVSPSQGAVAIKDVVKSTKRVGTDVKESKIVQSVKEAAQKSLDTISAERLAKRSDPDSAVYKAIKFSQENAESFGEGTVEESIKYTETLEELVTAAQKEIEESPGKASPELLNDFETLLDIASKIETVVNTRMEQGVEIDLETLAVTVEKTIKKGMLERLSPASLDKLKGGVLYSMQIDDTITEEQAKVFIKEGNLDTKERAIAIEYLKRIKNINEVAQDVVEGEGDLFVGAKSYARNVQAAVLSGNTEAANASLNKFKNFAGYMKVKASVFKNVWQHNYDLAQNKTTTVPKGIEIISQDANGKITEFRITDIAKYGVTTDGVSKVWNSSIDGAIRKLGRQVEKESKVINSYLAQATEAVGTGPIKKANRSVSEEEINVADQEEYYAGLETTTTNVTNEDLGDLVAPITEETTENSETTKVPPVKKTTKAVVLNPLEDKKTKSIEFFKRSIGTLTAKIENSNNLELIKRWEKKIVELEERISLTSNIDSTVPTKDSNVIEIANFADGRLASTNNGIISVKKGITKEEVLAYITNNKTRTGSQKAVVTQHMSEEYGVDLLSLLDGLNEKQIKEFIVEHEKHHITQKSKKVVEGKAHINNYGTDVSFSIATALNVKNASDNFFLNDTAIMMEAGANIKALRVVLNDSTIGSKTASVVAEVVTEAESELVTLDPNVIMLTKMIAGMKRDQEKAKKPETYTKRIDNLEIELQEATDKINAKEAARLADPKRNLEVYDLSKSIFADETVELEYLAELYGQDVQAIYLGSSIWGEDADAKEAKRTLGDVLQPKSAKEIQAEEDIKENLNSRDLFKTVRNIFGAIKKNAEFLKMSPAQLDTVKTLTGFNTQFTKKATLILRDISDRLTDDQGNYKKITTQYTHDGVQMDRFQENPLNYLLKRISVNGEVKGYLDPNILSMMAMHGIEFMATLSSATVYNDDAAVKSILGVDSKARVSNKQMAPFRKIGTSKSELANTIGLNIVKQLGLKGTPLADENFEAQLATALGLVTIDIMVEMGMLQPISINRSALDVDYINQNTNKLVAMAEKGESFNEPNSNEVVNFIRVTTERKGLREIVRNDIGQLIKNYSIKNGSTDASISKVLENLFGVNNQKRFPLFKPRTKKENSKYLRTDINIPEKVRKDLEYAQSIEWRFKPAIAALFSGDSRAESIEALKNLVGYKENLDDVPDYFKESEQAVNDSLLREIEDAVTFFDMLAESGQDQFYYSYNSWNNSRSGMNEAAVSPQASKIVRHLIYPTDPVTSESFNQELTLSDPFHIQMFKVAIIQSLYPSTKIDKNTLEKINSDFDANLESNRRNPITKAARSINNGTNPIVAANEAGLSGTIALDGLVALASYYKAIKEKKETITVDLGIETDATTSGLIISLLNSGRRSETALIKLAAGGAYTTVETNYVKHNLIHDDNYESLANIWKNQIQISEFYNQVLDEKETLTGTIGEAVTDLLGWPDRDAAKDPVMQSNYFAADNTLVAGYVDSSIDVLLKKLTDPKESVRLAALESLNNILQYDYTKLGGQKSFNNFRKIPAARLNEQNYKSFSLDNFQDLKFRVVVGKVYGGALRDALGEVGSEFGAIGASLNEAGNIAFQVYKALLNHVTDAVKGTTNAYYINNKQREAIENDPRVKTLFPTMRFIDTAEGEGIHAFKKNAVRNMDSGNRIIIRYSDSKANKGVKSTSARITKVQDSEPGVSLVARQIQGLDDSSARSVVGKFPVMHMFDAVFSPILHSIRNAQEYNQGTLDSNRNFSIYDNAVEMLSKIVEVMEDPKSTDIQNIILKEVAKEEGPLAGVNFKAMLNEALIMQEMIKKDKKQLFEEDIVFLDHMGLEGTGVENQFNLDNDAQYENEVESDVLNEWAESFLETEDPYSGPDPLGSDGGASINPKNFVHSDSEVLSGSNALEIFDSLGIGDRQGNSTDTAEHLSYLRNLLGDVVGPALNSLGNFSLRMRRAGNRNAGSIQDQEILLNFGVNNGSNILLNQGSERTTYVHELVHAITRFMFDDPKLSPIASEVVKLRERTRRYLNTKYKGEGWKVFMSPDEGVAGHLYDKAAEIAYAKGTYEYIFAQKGQFWTAGNEDKVSAKGIHEFVTFGLTDSRLIAELAEMPYKAERATATTFGGRIQELFLKVVDQIFNRIKKGGTTADKHLIQLVAALNKVDTKSRFNTNMIMKRITMGDNIAERAFTKYVFAPIAKASFKVADKSRGKGVVNAVARNAAMVVGAGVEGILDGQVPIKVDGQEVMLKLPFKKSLDDSRKRLRISKNSLLVYILRTITGPSNDMDRKVEHMLAKANMLIDQNRKNIAEGVRKYIEDSFLTSMEKKDWEALTLGILKTDLISLLPNNNSESIPRLIDLLLNTNNTRTNRIKNIREQLIAMGAIGNHYVQQSRGLGILMATGKVTVRMQRMNAYMIANSKGIVPSKQMPKDLIATQKLIDQLASLYALENNVSNANANTAAIIQKEFKANNRANGIIEFIGQAINLKQDALERNFNNDETHTVKGFIKNITNPNISVKIAPLADQKEMREMGYKLVSPLKDDTTSDPSKKAKALYSSDFVTMQDYNRGIMSTTSMKAAGTLLSQMLTVTSGENFTYGSAKNAVKAAVLSNSKEYAKHANNPDYAITDQSVMVPVFDTNQNIVDFRYLMADDTKVNVLKQELRSQVLLSSEAGSIEDKVKTSVVNVEALTLLKEDYDANYLKRSDEFVKISLTSGKAKHRELYNLLPTETRQQIKKVFGKDEILIDEQYIDIIFGQRSLSIANLPFLNFRAVKIAEVIWKELVSTAKKNIVIKTGSVLFHNIISNTIVGLLNGVPIEYMLKEQLRTARDLNNYMTVKRNLHVAKANLKSAQGLNNKQAIDDAQDSINSMSSVLNNSPVRELIRRGMFQSITEEIDSESDPYSYASAISNKVDEFAGKNKVLNAVNTSVKAIARYSYMTDDTSMYKLLLKTTQYSDFVARQAVFKYKTEVEKIGKDETENLVRDLFVNYDIPDHQILQYMNETGISMFTKYPMRMLRVIFKMMRGRPIEGIALIMLEDYIGMNIDDPSDMGFNLLNSPFSIVEDAFTQSGLEMAKEVF